MTDLERVQAENQRLREEREQALDECVHIVDACKEVLRRANKFMNTREQHHLEELEAACGQINKTPAELSTYAGKVLQERDVMREALEKLARLGNEPHYGNSDGNMIARRALQVNP
jgi:hypothetical protein